ncbi:MAG TPA: chromate efflux transporter [Steroidobacteraceae bacterium]
MEPLPVSLREATRVWARIGLLSFGGPAGQIALMHRELVDTRRWISDARFLHALNYCMLLPGPEAQQLATYIGWLLHRARGGLAAGLLFILPSFVILVALSWLYARYGQVPAIAAFFSGMKPAVVAIVAFAAWRIGTRVLRNAWLVGIAVLAFIALAVLAVPFPLIVIAAALAGFAGSRIAPRSFQAVPTSHGEDALIDEHSATPAHATFSWGRLAWVSTTGLVLWLAAMALLVAFEGGHGTLSRMAAFFSKAALVTFGGAYAVLPYVNQAAVEQYGWLSASQMVDGLALGETTPGPLIMVVTFVGYVGAWTHAAAVGIPPWLAGLAGATVVTYFTFLPSFVFIFAGGPLVEATRGRHLFTAPLAAVTAAVVGVIANLALYFARHVFWPGGLASPFDWMTLAIACGAALALFWFRLGVIPVILACGVAGLLVHL